MKISQSQRVACAEGGFLSLGLSPGRKAERTGKRDIRNHWEVVPGGIGGIWSSLTLQSSSGMVASLNHGDYRVNKTKISAQCRKWQRWAPGILQRRRLLAGEITTLRWVKGC